MITNMKKNRKNSYKYKKQSRKLPRRIGRILRNVSVRRALSVICGIIINVVLAYPVYRSGLSMYLDTIGTISVACIGGALPGILTAVATNVLCTVFNENAVYFSVLNVLIAICAAYFAKKHWFQKAGRIIQFILIAALISGGLGGVIQLLLFGEPQISSIVDTVNTLSQTTGLSRLQAFLLVNIWLNFFDKGLTTCAALIAVRQIPERARLAVFNSSWRQTPLSEDEIKAIKAQNKMTGQSIQVRMSVMLMAVSVSLVAILSSIGLGLYFRNAKTERTQVAMSAVRFAADVLDTDKINDYLKEGRSVPGYEETEDMLYKIRRNALGVEYLYVLKIEKNGCRFIFDLDAAGSTEVHQFEPGEYVEFEEAFEPYLPALMAGEEIEPIESDDIWDWKLTVYYPVHDEYGNCVCYVGADVSLAYMAEYMRSFGLKVMLMLAGFFIMILSYGLWTANVFVVYPVNSMAASANAFMRHTDDPAVLDEDVSQIKKLDIRTGDEMENLYQVMCDLTVNVTEQIRDNQHYSEAVAKMQNGLIITMADMVENRDSDTGAHIQKTAAYVRIILEGLKKKGYYAKKLTPKYMSDVEMSAPLHDVGKINIPDAVLNKPGRLTEEEYEIMKTHTTAGKQILEKAISTVSGENYLKEARNMAAYHHEKWDGSGYPEGLYGEVIPLSARIMAVADVFDALVSKRVYKPPMPLDKALSILQEGAGKDFDPKCIEVFMDSLDEVKRVMKKYGEY